MSDFREKLYESYASAFKEAQGLDDARSLRGYHAWARHRLLPLLNDLPRDVRVLEVGCGSGPMLELLREERFSHLRGVDVAPEMVARATARGLDVACQDVFRFLEDCSEQFGLVIALDFMEHFTKDELMELVPRLHDRLEPGGRLLVQTPNGEGLLPNRVVHGDLTHVTVFTPSSLEQLLRAHDFDNFTFAETGPAPTSIRGATRTLLWSAIRTAASAIKLIETGARQRIWTENLICLCRRREAT